MKFGIKRKHVKGCPVGEDLVGKVRVNDREVPAYDEAELTRILETVRPLTLDETHLVRKNRKEYLADRAAIEAWYVAECRSGGAPKGRGTSVLRAEEYTQMYS